MYFPYIRGREFELLALRELAANDLLGAYVIPIIEPVKLSPALVKTVVEYARAEHPVAIIRNPRVGTFMRDIQNIKPGSKEERYIHEFQQHYDEKTIIKSLIMERNAPALLEHWHQYGVEKQDVLVVNTSREFLGMYEQTFSDVDPRYALIPDDSTFRRRIKRNRIVFEDKMKKQANHDANQDTDTWFFSDDHLFFRDDGLEGFADYSVVGNHRHMEPGPSPYAVAIHVVYFAADQSLWVKHFVSDSNEDIANPAKKFYEALKKLYTWYQSAPFPPTLGLKTLLDHYENKTYPGLGGARKLSVMHHLELMGRYLSQKRDSL